MMDEFESEKLVKIEFEGKTYTQVLMSTSSDLVDSKTLEDLAKTFNNSECLGNAFKVAQKFGTNCIEGFVDCSVRNGDRTDYKIIRHCWNKIGDVHFDATNDFIWSKSGFKLQEFSYFPVQEIEPSEYVATNGQISFISNAPKIAEELNKQLE